MWLTIIALVPLLLWAYDSWALSYWRRRGVCQVGGRFLFGSILGVLRRKKSLQVLCSHIYNKYKSHGLAGFYSFHRPILLVTEPELVKQVLITQFNNYSSPGFGVDPSVDPMQALNPFGTKDLEIWKERRGMHVSVHTPAKLKLVPQALLKVGQNMLEFIMKSHNQVVSVKDLSEFFTMDAAACSGFGMETTAFSDPQNIFRTNARDNLFATTVDDAFQCAYLYPFIAKLFSIKTCSTEAQEFLKSLTLQLISQREKNQFSRGDIIDVILKTDKKRISEGKEGMGVLEKTSHVFAAFLDSYFTTSVLLRALILELVAHPPVQERLRAEILATGSQIEDFDFDTVNSLKYLQATLNEALRLNTVLSILARVCCQKTELGGVQIEKGTKVLIPAMDLHMDPDYYPNPERFLPERFEAEVTKGTFLPFGEGPRMCLGNRYAQLVIKLAIIGILLQFRILPGKTEQEKNPAFGPAIYLQPQDNITIRFQSL